MKTNGGHIFCRACHIRQLGTLPGICCKQPKAVCAMEMKALADSQTWPFQYSKAITADSGRLGWKGLRAFACNFDTARSPLCVPDDPDYLTVEINTALSANVKYQFGDRASSEVVWGPGDIWIYSNTERSKFVWDSPHSTVVFLLPFLRLKQLMMEGLDTGIRYPVMLAGIYKTDARLRSLLQLIAADMMGPETNGNVYIRSLVDATLVHLAKNYITENESIASGQEHLSLAQLEKVRKYVVDHVDMPLSVAGLAEAAGVKPFEFPRAFRTATGITPYQYVLKERIEWAEHLLRTSDLSLAEISFTVGFSSQSHFTRTFRKQKSVTPQSYRIAVS
ncbi:AraC family transcriptional regulator [Mesorhizobium shangrilense]|uniref:AraC family transcriptional regulator n=1 Tax=Mesorhizobium shangrilense TaxID=460060 RepID=A0ABV2DM75_9HYPH